MPPAALIPGDPAVLRTFATELTASGDRLIDAGGRLNRVNTAAGSGDAGERFRARFGAFTPQWFTAGDAFHGAAGAVTRYAEVLQWAQGRATDADRLQAHAQAVSKTAADSYNQAAAHGAAQLPFVDPGIALQEQAKGALDDARAQLDRAGTDAARAIQTATATAPAEPEAVVAASLGVGAILLGAGGDLGGGALSATGVGAIAGVPTIVASTGLIVGGAAAIGGATMEMARDARDNYRRPSGFRKGVRDTVFDRNKGSDGKVRDPKTNEEISKDREWDMGHRPGREFRKHQDSARDRGLTRKEFLDEHNKPDKYRPETPNTNRSRKLEDKTDQYGGDQ